MNDKRILLFWTSFNRAKFPEIHRDKSKPHPTLTEEWLFPRYNFWKKYTLQSVLGQSYGDFMYFFCCDAKTKGIINKFYDIKDPRVVLSFSKTSEELAEISRIAINYKEIYTMRVDSDDMYGPDAAQEVMAKKSPSGWYTFREGFGFDYQSERLWHYNCRGSGPFFARKYKTSEEFGQCVEINEMSHSLVDQQKPITMGPGQFIVNLTTMNTTTRVTSKTFKDEVTGDARSRILDYFGVERETI